MKWQRLETALENPREYLFERVLRTAQTWGTPDNLMFVVGATHPERIAQIREIAPDSFLLVPGVGAQGGDLQGISQHGLNRVGGLLVNSSREIIYASSGENFAEIAAERASNLQIEMSKYL